MKSHLLSTVSSVVISAAMGVLSQVPVRAQGQVNVPHARTFQAIGFRADASSPLILHLILQGEPVGTAIWRVLNGPVLSNPFGFLPAASGFNGATCQADYSHDEIVTQDGSSLTVDVYGFRCDPSEPTGTTAAKRIGIYSIVSGTGRFKDVLGGTGSIAFDSRSDGSVFVWIDGINNTFRR
jgi:hypothetical protein